MATLLADALTTDKDLSECLEVDMRDAGAFKRIVKKALELLATSGSLPNNSTVMALVHDGAVPVELTGKKCKKELFINGVKELVLELGLVKTTVNEKGLGEPDPKRVRLT